MIYFWNFSQIFMMCSTDVCNFIKNVILGHKLIGNVILLQTTQETYIIETEKWKLFVGNSESWVESVWSVIPTTVVKEK
jgi:hypothetical protein